MVIREGPHRCNMCGQAVTPPGVVETIDGVALTFHSQQCALTFKKLKRVYGKDFPGESLSSSSAASDP